MANFTNTSEGISAVNETFLDSEFRYVLFPVMYSIFFILGFFSNLYVLFVLWRLREARAMGEICIYMTNLTIADLLFVSALPFWISYYRREGDWIFNDFMCRMTGSFFFINTYGTILFLGAISLNRYWAVTRPLDAASSDHRCRGIIVCTLIWASTISTAILYMISTTKTKDKTKNKTRCFEGYQNKNDEEKRKVAVFNFLLIGMFFLVFFLVVICNFLIARALIYQSAPQSELYSETIRSNRTTASSWKRATKARGLKKKALQMLLAVVGVFVLCFLPHHIVQGPWTLAVLQITEGWGHVTWGQDTRQALNDAHQITWVLMGLNCILDPVVYFFATRKFRSFIMEHIRMLSKGETISYTANTRISMNSRNHSRKLQITQQQLKKDENEASCL
ncbi:PREDICTED: platelet-activating factor receptor-like [Cyprinodon variegatus]|uniref:platelet-activating factor receptor-like n=1 Tax=Cyprinodon variegatus TaxID=28743 RepID=UPI0007427B6C|nr:PREDICTED: platelet-activating factor receptor-like [Cyprinodon variegatus]XP_015234706.1 PREDICTED: platelet-activating factor receptor-like [Cyprinodon variegatus]